MRCNALQTAAAVAVLAVTASAQAQTRRVVIVNVATDEHAGQTAASTLRLALTIDQDFSPLPSGELSRALEDPLPSEGNDNQRRLDRAGDKRRAATDALMRGEPTQALSAFREAEALLWSADPSPEVLRELAEINFQLGLIYMGRGESDRALYTFRVARQFGSDYDMTDYPSTYVNAYEIAGLPRSKSAPVEVRTTVDGADIYVDGARAGVSPMQILLEPGVHYYYAVANGWMPAGARRIAVAEQADSFTISMSQVSPETQAMQARRDLLTRAGPVPNEAYRALAEGVALTGRFDLVLIIATPAARGLVVGTYNVTTDRLGPWTRYSTEAVDRIVTALPGRPAVELPVEGARPEPGQKWYKKWWVWTIAGSVALTAVGATWATTREPQPARAAVSGPQWDNGI